MCGTVGCMLILSWLVSLARWDSVVHKPKKRYFSEFEVKKSFADNLLTPMSSKMTYFFLQAKKIMKTFQDFSPYNALH